VADGRHQGGEPFPSCELSRSMPTTRNTSQDARLFISAKTIGAIPTRCALQFDALVQATLDAAVRSIEFVASVWVEGTQVELDAIVLGREDGRYLLDVVPARPLRDFEREGLVLIALDRLALPSIVLNEADIRREPYFANSRLVWSYRMHGVGIAMRLRILQALAEESPMPLAQLLNTVQGDRDPAPAVMALACADIVELDLKSLPLGPTTLVGSRA
jgi:hypothetical protein